MEQKYILMHDMVINVLIQHGAMCMVTNVIQSSPAQQAGIIPGDVIIQVAAYRQVDDALFKSHVQCAFRDVM